MGPDAVEIPQGLENDGPPDHEEYIPPAVPQQETSQETDNNSQGYVPSGDSNDSEGTGNTGGNPAWTPLLEKIPTPFHDEIKPFLSEWDSNFNKVQSQFAPYKPIIEQGIKPEDINQSLQLARLLSANPRLVYDQLAERFGFNSGQGREEETNEEDPEDNEENNFDNPMDDPRLAPFIQQQQQMAEYLQQQQAIQQEQQLQQEIQQEWQSIEKAHGSPIPQDIRAEMIQRAIFIADQKGTEPSLKEGYDSYNAFVNKVRGQKANNTAPQVFGGNGGLPSTPQGITGDMSDEDRINYIAERARILAQNQNSQ